MNIQQYILAASGSIALFYMVYLIISKKEKNFRQLRLYLILSIVISLLVPLTSFEINLTFPDLEKKEENTEVIQANEKPIVVQETNSFVEKDIPQQVPEKTVDWKQIIMYVYLAGVFTFISRFLYQLTLIIFHYIRSKKIKKGSFVFISESGFKNTFSFFNWIFIHEEDESKEDLDQILSHEKIHAMQYHTLDLILIQLLGALLWFNPFVWLMRSQIQLVHEYLADEGALSTGIDKLGYQALLINQITEERIISLSSSFNHSLIKKRMIMMTKSNFYQKTKLKSLAILPVAILLFLGVACVNGQKEPAGKSVVSIAPTKMNVVYLGVDNPLNIAVSGINSSELNVTCTNGTLTGENGHYVVKPDHPGSMMIKVEHNGMVIQETEFRVKIIPNPIAAVPKVGKQWEYYTHGSISKKALLDAGKIQVVMQNFDFDLTFVVTSFSMSATLPNEGKVKEEKATSGNFTDPQIKLIKSLEKGQKIMIDEIFAVGPVGKKRRVSPLVFTIE